MSRFLYDMNKCFRKARIKNPTRALKAIERIKSEGGPTLTYYYCVTCGNYHLTKKSGKLGRVVV